MFVPYTALAFLPLVYIIHTTLKIRNFEVQGNMKDWIVFSEIYECQTGLVFQLINSIILKNHKKLDV
jgi:hypothetical protein